MDIRQLRHFLAAIDHGTLMNAADAVHVTQQGLSKSIRALELSLGVSLLERGRFGVRPTPYGEVVANRARIICGYSRLAEQDVRALQAGDAGTVSIGVGPYFERQVVPPTIRKLSRLRPNVSIRVVTGPTNRLIDLLMAGEVDFTVSTPSEKMTFPSDIEAEVMFSERETAVVRATHPIARKKTCSMRDLAVYPWIMSVGAGNERERVTRLLRDNAKEWPPRVVLTDSVDTIVDLLKQDDFVHLCSPELLGVSRPRSSLASVPIDEVIDRRSAILARRKGEQLMPAVVLAQDLVREGCRLVCPDYRRKRINEG